LTGEKRIEEAEKRKEGHICRNRMRGRLRDTIDTTDRGNYSLESRIIDDDSNDDEWAGRRKVENGFG